MSLHLRKQMAQQIEFAERIKLDHTPEWYQQELLDAFTETDAHSALGKLSVLAAAMLTQIRRTDPSYGLIPVEIESVEDAFDHALGEGRR